MLKLRTQEWKPKSQSILHVAVNWYRLPFCVLQVEKMDEWHRWWRNRLVTRYLITGRRSSKWNACVSVFLQHLFYITNVHCLNIGAVMNATIFAHRHVLKFCVRQWWHWLFSVTQLRNSNRVEHYQSWWHYNDSIHPGLVTSRSKTARSRQRNPTVFYQCLRL